MAVQKHVSLERLQYFAQQFYTKINDERASAQDLANLLVKIGEAAIEANPEEGIEAQAATGLYKLIADGDADALIQAKAYADSAVASLVNAAPEALDTLKELADALGNDPDFATTILDKVGAIDTKVGNAAKGEQAATGLFKQLEDTKAELEAKVNEAKNEIPDVTNFITGDEVDTKIQVAGQDYAAKDHNHDDVYSKLDHKHIPADLEYVNEAYPDMANVKDALDELLYFAPTVKAFNASPAFGDYEIGSKVTNPSFTWSFNKDIVTQSLTECTVSDTIVRTASYVGEIDAQKTFTITAKDSKGTSCSKSGVYNFKHKRYWGIAEAPETYDSAFILGLTGKEFCTGRTKSAFSLTAGERQYFYYAFPASYGTPTFNVGGFDGGFELAATIDFTNQSGNTTSFAIWKSENANLGTQSIVVK